MLMRFLDFQTGTTALFFAAQAGYIDIAKILIRYGAYVDAASLVSALSIFLIKLCHAIMDLCQLDSFKQQFHSFYTISAGWWNAIVRSMSRRSYRYGKRVDCSGRKYSCDDESKLK